MRPVKFVLPLTLVAAFALSACNTIENRRSLYHNTKVHGPYTRSLEEGTWGETKPVDEQYSETQAQKKRPKLTPGQKKSGGSTSVPAVSTELPAQ